MEKTRASRSSRHMPGGYIRPPLLVRLSSEIRRNWMLMLMILPAVLYVLVFAYAPMPGIILAFKDFSYNKGIFGSPWSGLDNSSPRGVRNAVPVGKARPRSGTRWAGPRSSTRRMRAHTGASRL